MALVMVVIVVLLQLLSLLNVIREFRWRHPAMVVMMMVVVIEYIDRGEGIKYFIIISCSM